ncbi:hypothetical protein ACT29H_15235 [Thermophagus sp. OGC60D27]|uniref:hypothetical protein n=1 Tax=Thermophagus sp. OGC60D27 TaxID=3458415 RepID=UPI0040377AAF
MRKLLMLEILILVFNSMFSQDLIVTNSGDSINCKITKVKKDNIYFTFKHKDDIRSTLLPVANIKTHQFDYFQTSEVPKDKVVGYENYQHFRIAINGGYSYQTAKVGESVPSDFKDYVRDLKSGYHFGGDLTYYFTEILGFGFKYHLFKSSNSLDNIYLEDTEGNRTYGKMRDDLTISFIGPTFSTRLLSYDKRNAFHMKLSLGYMGYSNDKVIIDKYKMTGGTMGSSFDVGYDIGLSENLSLGFQISLLTGTLIEYDWDDGIKKETIELEKGEYESLTRIDFSVGLRFNK